MNIQEANTERTFTWCLFSSHVVYSHGVFCQCEPIISMLCIWAGFSFPCFYLFFGDVVFLWFFQSINIIMHLIVPVIELSSVSLCFFSSHFHVGVFLCDFFILMNVCLSLWCTCACVCQCLQRIWRRVCGRWRGSCCSWRETWRLSPPRMTPTTCSSLKWLYPFL